MSSASLSSPSSNEIDSHAFISRSSINNDFKSNPIVSFDLKNSLLKERSGKVASSNVHQNFSILAQEISKYSDTKFTQEDISESKNEKKTRKLNKSLDCIEFNPSFNNKSNQNDIFSSNNISDFNFNSLEMTLSLPTGISNNTR